MRVLFIGGKALEHTQQSAVHGLLIRGHEVEYVPSRSIPIESVRAIAEKSTADAVIIWQPRKGIPVELVETLAAKRPVVYYTIDVDADPPVPELERKRKACTAAIATSYTQAARWEAEGQSVKYFPPPYDVLPGRYNILDNPVERTSFTASTCYTKEQWPDMYLGRADMARALIAANVGFRAYGAWDERRSGWAGQGGMKNKEYYGGFMPHRYLPDLYHNSAVNVNSHVRPTEKHYLNERLIMCMGAGGFMLTDLVTGMGELEDGKHLVTWRSMEELQKKARYYFSHPTERKRIARMGQAAILRRYNCMEFARTVEGLVC